MGLIVKGRHGGKADIGKLLSGEKINQRCWTVILRMIPKSQTNGSL